MSYDYKNTQHLFDCIANNSRTILRGKWGASEADAVRTLLNTYKRTKDITTFLFSYNTSPSNSLQFTVYTADGSFMTKTFTHADKPKEDPLKAWDRAMKGL